MIVSRNGTSYDTSDGSQQPHEGSAERVQQSEREQINRWEDDGPGPHARAKPPAADPPRKPRWSVLSLSNLLKAIRQSRDEPTGPAAREREQARADRGRLAVEQDRRDNAENAERDQNRNAWENT